MADVIIYGAGDIGRIAHYYFTNDTDHSVCGFTVDKAYLKSDSLLGLPVIAFEDLPQEFPSDQVKMFVAFSYAKMNHARADAYHKAREQGYDLLSYVSSRCTFLSEHEVGDNCFILEDNTVQPYVTIGSNVTLWSGNHIGHDAIVQDHCFITSHVVISGRVRVEEYCFIGVNATLRNSITIGKESLIGAGAVIMRDTEPGSVYVPERAQRLNMLSKDVDL